MDSKFPTTSPSCNNEVNKLYTRELFEGANDWRTWCTDCWRDYRKLSPYS